MSKSTSLLFVLILFALSYSNCNLKAKTKVKSKATTFLQSKAQTSKPKTNYYSEDPEDYLSVKGEIITNVNCPLPNVADTDNKICFCEKGYANFPFSGVEGKFCQYKQKPQLTSFLVELFLGMGIGHFVIGQNIMGSFKLILVVLPCILGGLGLCGVIKTKMSEGTSGLIISILLYSMSFAWFIWWLTDAIMFGLNKYRDSNEVPLKAW